MLGFVNEFVGLLSDYEVACEHEHSNCVLIAHKRVSPFMVCAYSTQEGKSLLWCMLIAHKRVSPFMVRAHSTQEGKSLYGVCS